MASNDAILPARMASIQARERAIACSKEFPRLWVDGPALRGRVDDAFPRRTVWSERDRQPIWKARFPVSLRLVRSSFRAAQSDHDLIYADRDALNIPQNEITIRRPIVCLNRLLTGDHGLLNDPGDKGFNIGR